MLRSVVYVVVLFTFAVIIGYSLWLLVQLPTRKWRESAFDYVFVEDDGTARALSAEEEEQLEMVVLPGDEAHPYIKSRYESLTPDGKLSGYLRRRQLPKGTHIGPPPHI